MSIISASTTTTTALSYTADTTGTLVFKTGATPTTALTINADQTVTFAAGITLGALTTSGNLTFTGTGNRITGDFSNATVANRVMFQTSTTNYNTSVGVLPSGTATQTLLELYTNSDPTNASRFNITAIATEVSLRSAQNGTGTFLPLTMYTGGSERLRIDTSGNLGLGVVPSAWSSAKALQINTASSLFAFTNDTHLSYNGYYSSAGSYKYISTDYASDYQQTAGQHRWFTAASGTAGTVIPYTQAMTLDASGNLGIGTSSPGYKLDVTGTSNISSSAYFGGLVQMANNREFQIKDTTGTAQNVLFMFTDNNVYLSSPVTGASLIFRGVGFAERMRIDSSGNVGIGMTTPTSKLNVFGGSLPTSGYGLSISSNLAATRLTTDASSRTAFIGSYFDDTALEISQGSTSGYVSGIVISSRSSTNATLVNAIALYTQSAERMRLDSSGNLLVGCTANTNSGGFILYKDYDAANSASLDIGHITGSASGNRYTRFQYAGSTIGSITQNGTTAVAYNTSSDYRLKENIAPMTGALATVAQLKPVTYNWKADGSDGQGFIAHELQEVVPECVTGEKDAVDADGNPQYQGIDTSFLVATLTAAIQELKAEFDEYKATHP